MKSKLSKLAGWPGWQNENKNQQLNKMQLQVKPGHHHHQHQHHHLDIRGSDEQKEQMQNVIKLGKWMPKCPSICSLLFFNVCPLNCVNVYICERPCASVLVNNTHSNKVKESIKRAAHRSMQPKCLFKRLQYWKSGCLALAHQKDAENPSAMCLCTPSMYLCYRMWFIVL